MVSETIHIRPMKEDDLEEVDNIMRLAFGTFLGLPEPIKFMGDADYVMTRFRADPPAALTAFDDNKIIGSNFALDWGSVGVFGPLTIHPDYWDKGVAKALLDETMKIFQRWGSKHLGLFTFAQSTKHVHLYQKYNFWPRYLTAVMSKNIPSKDNAMEGRKTNSTNFSTLSESQKSNIMMECRNLTDAIFEGLDLRKEIESVDSQKLGDTIVLQDRDSSEVLGFAVCHVGSGSEAGSGNCYVKFGAIRPKDNSAELFSELMNVTEQFALSRDVSKITAGINTARHNAYRIMIEKGFRTDMQGVTMHRPNEPGYNLPDVYVIDDWR